MTLNTEQDIIDMLRWHVDMGADEAIGDVAIDRFAASAKSAKPVAEDAPEPQTAKPQPPEAQPPEAQPPEAQPPEAPRPAVVSSADDSEALAISRAGSARSLDELRAVVDSFQECALKRTATNMVFADGNADADLMFIGEAPGAEEDRQGKPFVGPSGRLLDRMMAALGMTRQDDYYIANILPWRPPGNRKPTPAEQAICLPFVLRQIELVKPKVIVCLGGTAAGAILDTTEGITRIRGRWKDAQIGDRVIPAMPTYHPAYLLRQPRLKGDAWRDLLEIRARLVK